MKLYKIVQLSIIASLLCTAVKADQYRNVQFAQDRARNYCIQVERERRVRLEYAQRVREYQRVCRAREYQRVLALQAQNRREQEYQSRMHCRSNHQYYYTPRYYTSYYYTSRLNYSNGHLSFSIR